MVTTEVPLADRWLAFAASLDNSTNSSDWNSTAADADVATVAPLSWDFKFMDRLSLAVSGLQHLDALVESKKRALEEELSKQCAAPSTSFSTRSPPPDFVGSFSALHSPCAVLYWMTMVTGC